MVLVLDVHSPMIFDMVWTLSFNILVGIILAVLPLLVKFGWCWFITADQQCILTVPIHFEVGEVHGGNINNFLSIIG